GVGRGGLRLRLGPAEPPRRHPDRPGQEDQPEYRPHARPPPPVRHVRLLTGCCAPGPRPGTTAAPPARTPAPSRASPPPPRTARTGAEPRLFRACSPPRPGRA